MDVVVYLKLKANISLSSDLIWETNNACFI